MPSILQCSTYLPRLSESGDSNVQQCDHNGKEGVEIIETLATGWSQDKINNDDITMM